MVFRGMGLHDPQLSTTVLGLVNVGFTLLSICLMDKAGRRTLLLLSWALMFFCYVALTFSYICATYSLLPAHMMHSMAVVSTAGVLMAFAIGPGCIAWFVIAEIFPLYARDVVLALGVAMNWLINALVALVFPTLHAALGPFTFVVFALFTFGFGCFSYAYVPETRHKTPLEINAEFGE